MNYDGSRIAGNGTKFDNLCLVCLLCCIWVRLTYSTKSIYIAWSMMVCHLFGWVVIHTLIFIKLVIKLLIQWVETIEDFESKELKKHENNIMFFYWSKSLIDLFVKTNLLHKAGNHYEKAESQSLF